MGGQDWRRGSAVWCCLDCLPSREGRCGCGLFAHSSCTGIPLDWKVVFLFFSTQLLFRILARQCLLVTLTSMLPASSSEPANAPCRFAALNVLVKAFKPTLEVAFIASLLGFVLSTVDDGGDAAAADGAAATDGSGVGGVGEVLPGCSQAELGGRNAAKVRGILGTHAARACALPPGLCRAEVQPW